MINMDAKISTPKVTEASMDVSVALESASGENSLVDRLMKNWARGFDFGKPPLSKFSMVDCKDFRKIAETNSLPISNVRNGVIVFVPVINRFIKVFKNRRAARAFVNKNKFYMHDIAYNYQQGSERIDCEITLKFCR